MPDTKTLSGGSCISMSTAAPAPENEQQQVSEALSLLDKAVLEMIMDQQPVARVLETLCLRIEESSPGLTCSVLLLDQPSGTLQGGIGPSLPQSYLEAVNGVKIGPQSRLLWHCRVPSTASRGDRYRN